MQRFIRELIEQVTVFGGMVFIALLALAFLLAGNGALALWIVIVEASALGIVTLVRAHYKKPRPKPRKATDALGTIDSRSFPSLHATRSTALAMTITLAFGRPWACFAWALAAVVWSSRIVIGAHDWRDVLAGIVLGLCIVLALAAALPFWFAS